MRKYSYTILGILMILVAHVGHGENTEGEALTTDKLAQDFLGIHLGCSLTELKEYLANPKYPIKFMEKSENGESIVYYFMGNHRLKGAVATNFEFWEGKLLTMGVIFEGENAKKIYDALRHLASQKYGEMKDVKVSGEKQCRVVNGVLEIALRYKSYPFDDDSTYIMATHAGLEAARDEKKTKKAATDFGEL